jgi:hypothetical protein
LCLNQFRLFADSLARARGGRLLRRVHRGQRRDRLHGGSLVRGASGVGHAAGNSLEPHSVGLTYARLLLV